MSHRQDPGIGCDEPSRAELNQRANTTGGNMWNTTRTTIIAAVAASWLGMANAQVPPAPAPENDFFGGPQPLRMQDYSWIQVPTEEPRVIKVHDIISIIVDEKAEVISNSRFNRSRASSLKAELKEFIRIDDKGNLATAAPNQPTIDANLQGRLNSTGQLTDQEGIRYRIAATVVDVLPNGNLVLEARKSIRSNRDVWEYRLTGTLRSEDVSRDNTALSENIVDLNIVKNTRGKVYDSTKRPWGVRLYDLLSPF